MVLFIISVFVISVKTIHLQNGLMHGAAS